MGDTPLNETKRRKRGQVLFALLFLLFAIFLLVQLGEQTRWVAKTKLFAQPRFWPAVSLGAMVVFAGLHFWRLPRRNIKKSDIQEGSIWLRPLEYALYFMAYVWAVPFIGFLPASLFFAPLMCYRMGYRQGRYLWVSAGFGLAVVVVFKSLLSVKIPGGAVYEYLPGALRSFFILNF